MEVFSLCSCGEGGCRVSDEHFVHNRIGTFVSFYLRTNLDFADTYIKSELDSMQESKEFLLAISKIILAYE